MSDVKRYKYVKYDTGGGYIREGIEEHPEGEWTRFEQTDALAQQLAQVTEELGQWRRGLLINNTPALQRAHDELTYAKALLLVLKSDMYRLSDENEQRFFDLMGQSYTDADLDAARAVVEKGTP